MRVYINYVDADQPVVTPLGDFLRERGHQPWVDTPQPGGAPDLQAATAREALELSAVAINIVSEAAVRTGHWHRVIDWMVMHDKPALNVVLTPVAIPAPLRGNPTVAVEEHLSETLLATILRQIQALQARARQPGAPAATAPTMQNDLPEGDDTLGFADYAAAFAQIATNPAIKPPLTVGIYGPWGSGKTFLMHRIGAEIEAMQARRQASRRRDPDAPRILTIEFDAWAYNASEVLWAGLVQQIFKKIEDQLGNLGRWELTLRRNLQREGRQLLRRMIYLALLLVAVLVPAYLVLRELNANDLAAILPFLSLPVLVRLGRDLARLLSTPQSRQVAAMLAGTTHAARERRLVQSVIQAQESDSSTLMARFYDDMDKMLEALPPNSRLIVFIDDLDRCKPDRVVEVLEAINLLLAFREFIVFMAVDTRVVARIIEATYQETLREAGVTGYEYLDKIVQIPFTIPRPRPRDVMRYLNTLIEAPPGEVSQAAFGEALRADPDAEADLDGQRFSMADFEMAAAHLDDEDDAEAADVPATLSGVPFQTFSLAERSAFRAYAAFLDPTPRRIKRLVNVYRLVRVLGARSGNPLAEGAPAKVILWLILAQQWPYATARLLDAMRHAEGTTTLQYLYDAIAPTLDDDPRHRTLDYDSLLLAQIMARYGQHMRDQDMVDLQSLTLNFHPALLSEMHALSE